MKFSIWGINLWEIVTFDLYLKNAVCICGQKKEVTMYCVLRVAVFDTDICHFFVFITL